MIKKTIEFLQKNIWRTDIETLPRFQAFLVHHLRVILLAITRFSRDDCLPRASALTYYTLLSIVPVLAMAFGIAKGFGLEEALNRQLEHYLGAHEEILEQVVSFSYSLLEETSGGIIAGIGFIFLLWSVIRVMTYIELSFNVVWRVKYPRGWERKISEYLSIMLIAPFLIIISGSINVFLSTELGALAEYRWLGFMDVLASLIPRILPYILIWLLFIFVLMAMPNARVRLKPAVLAGIISGTMFQLMQWAYIALQVGAVKYNAVYGSFAALPLFLVWLQASWMIVLFGSELSFAYTNIKRFIFATEVRNISLEFKSKISIAVMRLIIRNFMSDGKAATPEQIQQKLGLPQLLVQHTLNDLLEANLIVRLSNTEEDSELYHPGKDINLMTISFILKELQKSGYSDIPITQDAAWQKISQTLDHFEKTVENSSENVLLKDID